MGLVGRFSDGKGLLGAMRGWMGGGGEFQVPGAFEGREAYGVERFGMRRGWGVMGVKVYEGKMGFGAKGGHGGCGNKTKLCEGS